MKKPKSKLMNRLFALLSQEVKNHQTVRPDFERRKFIVNSSKGIAALAIASGLPTFITSCKTTETDSSNHEDANVLDIAILGGGIAGLNCANHLLDSGLKFKIFEADRRMGGRILTHYNDPLGIGVYPEFGGDFVDSDHEDMLALAKEFNLGLVDLIQEQEDNHWVKDIYFFDGRRISEKEVIREFKKIAPKIAEDTASLGENYDTDAAKKLDNLPLSDYIKNLNCAKWMKELLVAAFVAEFGLDCEQQSTINLLDIIDTNTDDGFKVFGSSDERYRISGGNSKVIEGLVNKVGEDKIEKNYEVKSVIEQKDGTYLIAFSNEETVQAKVVVCTIPFTILRKLKLELKNMSAEKRKCIDELGYGNNTKLVLGYEGQPWRSKENNAMGYLFTNDMTNGWDGSVNKAPGSTHGAYVAFFGGDFSQKLCDVSSKNPMSPPTHVWRTELPKERVDSFVNELDKIFKHSKEKFLGKHIFVNWIEYPFVKASYSCYKPGQWTSISGLEMQPIGNFFFAGEHCSKQFQGFMNGGAETGRRVAETIVKMKKKA